MRDLKKITALKIIQAIKNNKSESRRDWLLWMMKRAGSKNGHNKFQFWIQHSHPIVLDTPEILWQRLDYIHNNPVVSGRVLKAEEFVYSSAYDYFYDQEGKVPLGRINRTP